MKKNGFILYKHIKMCMNLFFGTSQGLTQGTLDYKACMLTKEPYQTNKIIWNIYPIKTKMIYSRDFCTSISQKKVSTRKIAKISEWQLDFHQKCKKEHFKIFFTALFSQKEQLKEIPKLTSANLQRSKFTSLLAL